MNRRCWGPILPAGVRLDREGFYRILPWPNNIGSLIADWRCSGPRCYDFGKTSTIILGTNPRHEFEPEYGFCDPCFQDKHLGRETLRWVPANVRLFQDTNRVARVMIKEFGRLAALRLADETRRSATNNWIDWWPVNTGKERFLKCRYCGQHVSSIIWCYGNEENTNYSSYNLVSYCDPCFNKECKKFRRIDIDRLRAARVIKDKKGTLAKFLKDKEGFVDPPEAEIEDDSGDYDDYDDYDAEPGP